MTTALLGQLLARHRATEEARRWVRPTLQLRPAHPGATLIKLPAVDGSVDGYSAKFAVPAATPAGFYAVALDNGLGGPAAQLAVQRLWHPCALSRQVKKDCLFNV